MHNTYEENTNGRYTLEYSLVTNDIDIYSRWNLKSILAVLQEVAERHCRSHGYGFYDLRKKNACWVCLRYNLRFYSYPKLYDNVTVSTWAEEARMGIYPRMFLVEDEAGEILVRAFSMWAIIDLDKRSIINAKDYGLPQFPFIKIDGFEKLNSIKKLKKLEGEEKIIHYNPLYSDFDMNGHVNNTAYLEWFDNQFTIEEHENNIVRALYMNYDREIRPEDELELELVKNGKKIYFAGHSERGKHFSLLAQLE